MSFFAILSFERKLRAENLISSRFVVSRVAGSSEEESKAKQQMMNFGEQVCAANSTQSQLRCLLIARKSRSTVSGREWRTQYRSQHKSGSRDTSGHCWEVKRQAAEFNKLKTCSIYSAAEFSLAVFLAAQRSLVPSPLTAQSRCEL